MNYFFEPAATPAVPVVGSSLSFPVHRIYCVGRNYAEHAVEMGGTGRGQTGEMPYPPRTTNLHYEVELVVAIGRGGHNIPVKDAYRHIFGYAVGLDMTRRDLQTAAKKEGKPWDVAKGFDHSAPIAPLRQINQTGQMLAGKISLQVNGETRQSGDVASMIWVVAEVIAELSTLYELQPGDLIYTGTPAGVGAVQRGDIMVAQIDKLGELKLKVV
jgi:fumarylpyruvate hydrolase